MYRPGDWKTKCDLCGATRYASECRLDWRDLFVCSDHCWSPRPPQDFVSSIPDNQSVPIARPSVAQPMGSTTVKVSAISNATAIDLTSVSGISDGDAIGIVLNDSTVHWTFSDGTPVGTVVTLGSYLPFAATAGNVVYLPSINSEIFNTATSITAEDL
jgi:hypothetical protein